MEHKGLKLQKITDLVPYARNSRTHSDEQIAQIASSIREFGWTNPVLVDKNNTIIAGHGRVMGARRLGIEEVPTICLDHLTEAQVRAYVIADNKLALNAGWDEELLTSELENLKAEGYELGLVGFTEQELEQLKAFTEENKDAEVVKYSTELDQQSNYVVLKFSKDIDWIQAETLLGIESTYSLRQNGKTWSKGVGRVLDGSKAIEKLTSVNMQDLIESAKQVDAEYVDSPTTARQEMAKRFIEVCGWKNFLYFSSFHKTVVVVGGYAVGFCDNAEIARQRAIADKLESLYVPTYYWGNKTMVQSRCYMDGIEDAEWKSINLKARQLGIVDVHKDNVGKIGDRLFIFDAKESKAKNEN